jgi:vacuolar-type H+-ATPase subunit E/Vma4
LHGLNLMLHLIEDKASEKIKTILQDAETQKDKILTKAKNETEEKAKKTLKLARTKFETFFIEMKL